MSSNTYDIKAADSTVSLESIAKIIRRAMQDHAVAATVRSERAAEEIAARLGRTLAPARETDPMESLCRRALLKAGIDFITDHEPESPAQLDFYLPDGDLHIEVKRFHSERVAEQLRRADNVILLQGAGAVRFFATLLPPATSTTSTAEQVSCMKDGDASDAEMGRICRKYNIGTPERFEEVMAKLRVSNPPGEGEAPVAWQRRMRNTKVVAGDPKAEWSPWMQVDARLIDYARRHGRVEGFPELEAQVRPLYTRPTPATPEGLREKLEAVIAAALARETCGDRPTADDRMVARAIVPDVLAALQPQAQGGE